MINQKSSKWIILESSFGLHPGGPSSKIFLTIFNEKNLEENKFHYFAKFTNETDTQGFVFPVWLTKGGHRCSVPLTTGA